MCLEVNWTWVFENLDLSSAPYPSVELIEVIQSLNIMEKLW